MESSYIIGVVSGYFNPLGRHHIRYLKGAKAYLNNVASNNKLVVIVNNDDQVKLKGSCPFQNSSERQEIIASLKYVDKVVLSIDTDESVVETLKYIEPDFVFNGGDRNNTTLNPKEVEYCNSIGCKIITGIGGAKSGSSSKTIEDAVEWVLNNQLKTSEKQKTNPGQPSKFLRGFHLE